MATGNLKVVPYARVIAIESDAHGRVTGARYLSDKKEYFQPASVVLLASHTYENTRYLFSVNELD